MIALLLFAAAITTAPCYVPVVRGHDPVERKYAECLAKFKRANHEIADAMKRSRAGQHGTTTARPLLLDAERCAGEYARMVRG